jgi:bile salt-stimulated lipase
LAVEWIYKNAHLFGGDPHRIVLAGHSAGAGNVMLIPGRILDFLYLIFKIFLASQYCRGMIKRVISQSGTGLAPWSINHQPMKLIERLSREFNCQRTNETEMFQCIQKLLKNSDGDFYRLHLSLSIGMKKH